MKNILAFMILVFLISCIREDNAPPGPANINKYRSLLNIAVSYPKTCENSLSWGKITISIAATKEKLTPGSTIASSSFITNADPSKDTFTCLLGLGTYYYKVDLLSYCNSQPNFEEVGSFVIKAGNDVDINVTIK